MDSVDTLRDLKDIRNEVVHEYAVNDLSALYHERYTNVPG